MAGPGDERAAHLRASRADREQVIGVIKTAFVQGRLARDEFDQRVGLAMAPRTYAELAALTADLPVSRPPRQARPGGEPMRHPGRLIAVATALYAGAWGYELLLSPHVGDNPAAHLLIVASVSVYLAVLLIGIANVVALRREKRR